MPVLTDYQFQIGSLVLGGNGNNYILNEWTGAGIPGMRVSDSDRPQDYGTFLGPDLLEARYIRLTVTVRGNTPEQTVANADVLLREWYVDSRVDTDITKPLSVKLPGQGARRLIGRPRRTTLDPNRIIGTRAEAILEYHASDPRWYSDDEHTSALALAAATTGRSYNKGFNYGYGAGASGIASVVNAGTIGTLPVVRFTGPVTNPYIENITTAKTLGLTYTLGAGEFIDVDFGAATVLLAGTASRYYAKTGSFFELIPGVNEIRFGAGAYDAASSASITWRDAWL